MTAGQHHVKVWSLRFESEAVETHPSSFQQEYNNSNRGNVNTGYLSKNDRELFTSLQPQGKEGK